MILLVVVSAVTSRTCLTERLSCLVLVEIDGTLITRAHASGVGMRADRAVDARSRAHRGGCIHNAILALGTVLAFSLSTLAVVRPRAAFHAAGDVSKLSLSA